MFVIGTFFILQSKMLVLFSSKFIVIIVIPTEASLASLRASSPGSTGVKEGRGEGRSHG